MISWMLCVACTMMSLGTSLVVVCLVGLLLPKRLGLGQELVMELQLLVDFNPKSPLAEESVAAPEPEQMELPFLISQ